jgi:hypothetical protein
MCDYYAATRAGAGTTHIVSVIFHLRRDENFTTCIGVLRVGRIVSLHVVPYKRKRVGPKNKGEMLFMKIKQHNVMPEKVDNFYACAAVSDTSIKYVRVQDLCTLLAEVKPRTVSPNMVNLVPIAHAFPVSWVAL